jgi:GxxExxY protein
VSDDELGTVLIGCAISVHTALGPGLLESVYETCLMHELGKNGIGARRQVSVPIAYDGLEFDEGLRVDLLLDDRVVVELKAVERLLPIHTAQLLTYLKLTGLRVGYLLNFNVVHLREGGIKRVING